MQAISLGKITPGSTTPAAVNANKPTVKRASKLSIRSLASNSGAIYIGAVDMNTTTLDGVIEVLDIPGDRFVLIDEQSTAFQLDALFVLATNGSDAVLAVGYQR